MESLRITTAYFDGKFIWAVDDVVSGLYTVDISTRAVSCVVEPIELYRYPFFDVALVFERDNCIVLIPKILKYEWAFYDKKTKKVSFRKILEIDIYVAEARIIGDFIYIPLLNEELSFIIFDVKQMKIHSIVKNIFKEKIDCGIWNTFEDGDMCCFPLRGTKIIYGISSSSNKIIEAEIDEKLGDADGENGQYWILPLNGTYIYQIDGNGKIVDQIELYAGNEKLNADNFVRIISMDKYLFLLPSSQGDIWVYEKSKRRFSRIKPKYDKLSNRVPYDVDMIPYWGYFMDENRICFLPRMYKLLCVEFDDLNILQEDVFLPDRNDYDVLNKWIRMFPDNQLFLEREGVKLQTYIEYQKIRGGEKKADGAETGRAIYDHLRETISGRYGGNE